MKPQSEGQLVFHRFIRHRAAMVGLAILLLIVIVSYSSVGVRVAGWHIPGWWKYDHTALLPIENGGHPTRDHPFGQDVVGHDVFALTMKGVQTSIYVMVVLSVVACLMGITVGAIAGYYRGWVDHALMRLTDLVITFPVIVIGAVLGKLVQSNGPTALAVALGLIFWTTLARLVRGEFLTLREREFVDAARVAGASGFRIIRKHLLPNAMGVIIVNTTLLMAAAVLLETGLSFLGFGISSPDISLGKMISDYQAAFSTRPWLFWWPGFFIIVLALSVNFVGDGLRDAFDPRQQRLPSARWRFIR
ncbi:ABC transporter permease [Smaragdicoccus niigatensis]|uniref:ABC transporter permease n=1 Tax=Smaragdicoccus niigatensis TaxID=359359 RepID=UPI0003A66710|nr:ABC transporter permease [Smaragdicoccus niigatensis]